MKTYIKYIIAFVTALVSLAVTALVYPNIAMPLVQQVVLNISAIVLFFLFKIREVLLNGKFILSKFLRENTPRIILGLIAVILVQFFITYDLVFGTNNIVPLLSMLGVNANESSILLSVTLMGLFYDLKGKEQNEK